MTTTLMLIVGLSPEAPTLEAAFGGKVPANVARTQVNLGHVKAMYEKLSNTSKDTVDVVVSGCLSTPI